MRRVEGLESRSQVYALSIYTDKSRIGNMETEYLFCRCITEHTIYYGPREAL